MPKRCHMRRQRRRRSTEYIEAIEELRQVFSENIPQNHLIVALSEQWQNSRRDFMAIDKRNPNCVVIVRVVRKEGKGKRVEMRFSVFEPPYAYDWVFADKPALRSAIDIGRPLSKQELKEATCDKTLCSFDPPREGGYEKDRPGPRRGLE